MMSGRGWGMEVEGWWVLLDGGGGGGGVGLGGQKLDGSLHVARWAAVLGRCPIRLDSPQRSVSDGF